MLSMLAFDYFYYIINSKAIKYKLKKLLKRYSIEANKVLFLLLLIINP